MVETPDVVVIGGGVIGTGIACALASAGVKRVTLFERSALASGASGRAFDCYSADRHAILGAVRGIDGPYLATAFSGSGFKIAPAIGTCPAKLVTEGPRAHRRPLSLPSGAVRERAAHCGPASVRPAPRSRGARALSGSHITGTTIQIDGGQRRSVL